ncbi:MAG: hypothetical protein HZB50_05590 [Chloroflexi bacterium]|nr:hypothetical protein [Chloroflexota bacterium]
MIRYTIEVVSKTNYLDMIWVQAKIEAYMTKNISIFKTRDITQDQGKGVILLETELPPAQMLKLAKALISETSGMAIKIKDGWALSKNTKTHTKIEEKEFDPFYDEIIPGSEDESCDEFFASGGSGKIFTMGDFVLLVFGIAFLYFKYLNTGKFRLFASIIFLGVIIYALYNTLLYIKCDKAKITFKYILRPPIAMSWEGIESLIIYQARGTWIKVSDINITVKFPSGQIGSQKQKYILLKNIITKAGLCYVEASDKIVYKRPHYLV